MAEIRKMQETDAGAVLKLWDAAGLEIHGGSGFSEQEAANVLAVLKRYPHHDDAFCFVAEEEGELVGFVLAHIARHPIYEDSSGVGEVGEFYVQPASRPNGVGSRLAEQIVAVMRERGVAVIHAHGSMDSPALQDFWAGLGWYKDTVMFSWYDFEHEVK